MPTAPAVPASSYPYTDAAKFDGMGGSPDLRNRVKQDLALILAAELGSTALPASVRTDPRREFAAACDVADAYLNIRYVLPLLAWPALLTELVNKIAGWELAGIYGLVPDGTNSVEYIRYSKALKTLEGIRNRQLDPSGFQDSSQTGPESNPRSSTASISSNESRGW